MTLHSGQADWQTLRKDKRCALIVLLIITAGVAAILGLIGVLLGPSRSGDRANPVYWALLLPFAWWAASLANYTPWATRHLRSAGVVAVVTAIVSLAAASRSGADQTPWLIAAGIAMGAATAGLLLYPNSLLAQRS